MRQHGPITAALIGCLLFSAAAAASDTPVLGGTGGGRFDSYCGAGSFMTGIRGRTGDWIDAMQPLCSRWNPATKSFDRSAPGPSTGGGGGGNAYSGCDGNAMVKGWEIAKVQHGRASTVQYVRLRCLYMPFNSGLGPSSRPRFGGNGFTRNADIETYDCRPGELAVGIYGFSGAYIDAVGLHCATIPQ